MSAVTPDTPRVNAARVDPGLALAVSRVSPEPATHAAIAAAWLCGDEHGRSARFLVDHARADFLAGRAAAKSAIRLLASNLPAPNAWEIRRGEHHRPVIEHVLPDHQVSIAHAAGIGLALAHPTRLRCGVDLEPLERAADDAIATQVTPPEAAWARSASNAAEQRVRWLLLWTAREAQGKSLGTGILEPSRLAATEAWTELPRGWQARLLGDREAVVRSVIAVGCVVTFVVPTSAPADSLAAHTLMALEGQP